MLQVPVANVAQLHSVHPISFDFASLGAVQIFGLSLFRCPGVGRDRRAGGVQTRLRGPGWIGPGAAAEDPRTAGAAHPGASSGGIMAGKTKDPEFRHPNTVAHMRSLTDEEAAEHPPVIRKAGGVCTEYWREGGRVRCREVGAGEASGGPAPELGALLAAAEAAFGRSLPRMRAELRGGGVPDLDALETAVRDGMLDSGARGYAALLEALDAELPAPSCPDCGRSMERQGRIGKTLLARLGQAGIKRRYYRCRECGGGAGPRSGQSRAESADGEDQGATEQRAG